MNQSFSIQFSVEQPVAKLIEAISNPAGWWATNITGDTKNPCDVFTVRFGKTFATIKITEVIAREKIVWSVVDCDLPLFQNPKDWLHTKLVWNVTEANGSAQLTFTHEGLIPGLSCYEDCTKGWTYFVGESLRKLNTEGKGMPGSGIFGYIIIDERRYEGLIYFKKDPLPEYSNEYICIDVLETKGEQVTKAGLVQPFSAFNPAELQGEYFMVMENKPLYENIIPIEDAQKIIA